MSNKFIQDGTGRGFLCKVDNTNKLEVHAVGIQERGEAVQQGRGFEIGAAPINFTGTAETALIYISNNEDISLVLDAWDFSGSESTGGTSNVCLLKLYQGATGITNGTAGGAVNSLFGAPQSLDAVVETGNGSTSAVTGGTLFGASYIAFAGRGVPFNGPWVLPKGQSIALTITPPASNTSLNFGVRILCHLQRED